MNEDTALLELRRQAHTGSPPALFRLASALVVRHELDEAFTLHRRAAEAGLANAQIEYARMLMYGVGCTADAELAAAWFLRAEMAERQTLRAQTSLPERACGFESHTRHPIFVLGADTCGRPPVRVGGRDNA